MRWIRVRMRSIVARQSMLSTRQQASRKQRKGGPENETENRPEIGPAGQFHRQCVEPFWCPFLGVDRRSIFFLPWCQMHSIVATPSMLGSIGPVRKHPTVNNFRSAPPLAAALWAVAAPASSRLDVSCIQTGGSRRGGGEHRLGLGLGAQLQSAPSEVGLCGSAIV